MELLEREQCLADLAAWLAAVAESGGCIALVRGEAGVGKTVLLQQFCKLQREARVLWGACDALFTPQPLAPVHDIARQTQGALFAAVNSEAKRDVIFTAMLDELEREKTLIIFEDLHWADEATLDLLKYLGRRIHRTQAMLAVTYRDDEVGAHHPLRFVIGDLPRASTRRMSPAPFSAAAVAQLANRTGRASKDLHRITGGNPLFVTEVLATAVDIVPATVRDAVLSRMVRLSPEARKIAELACVIPGKTENWLLEQTVRADEAAIESCLSIGMVRHEDGSLAYRHELVRRALEDSLSLAYRQRLHAKVLTALTSQPDIPGARMAHHAAGARNAEAVLRFAPAAATQAASVGAHREAAAHYEVALQHAQDLSSDERARLLEQLSYESHLVGQHERAIEAQRLALETWRALGQRQKEGNALRWLARLSWFAGHSQAGGQYDIAAIEILESLPPSPELAMAYCQKADLHMEFHEEEAAVEWAQRAIALGERWANSEILSHALCTLGMMRVMGGDAAGWADLDRSLKLALAAGLPERVAGGYMGLGAMAISRREYEPASRYIRDVLAYCEERDMDSWWLYALAYRARMRFEQGDWNGASDDAEAVLRHPGATAISRIPALRILGHLRIRRGDPDASSPLAEARALGGPAPELQRTGTLAAICAEAAWLAGDRQGVVREVQPVYELVQQRRDPRMKGELAAWLWRVGALKVHPADILEPYALEISSDWRGAARAWQALGCPYEHASMLAWYGAEAEQREALTMLEQLGAAPALQALRKQMRNQGVRGVPRGSRTSTRSNPFGLTEREAKILALLTEGLSNLIIAKRLFVSTRTVENHVSAILAKLGVPSRAQAIAMAREEPRKGI